VYQVGAQEARRYDAKFRLLLVPSTLADSTYQLDCIPKKLGGVNLLGSIAQEFRYIRRGVETTCARSQESIPYAGSTFIQTVNENHSVGSH
jgi:hypothetical protein